MSSVVVVKMNELFQFLFQVILIERNEEIQKFISTCLYPTFRVTILPRRTKRVFFVFDADFFQVFGKAFPKNGIVVGKKIMEGFSLLNLLTNGKLQNLSHPICSRVCMNIEMKNLSRADVKKENDAKDLFEIGRVNGKSIGNNHRIGMQRIELFPRKTFFRTMRTFGNIFRNGSFTNIMTEL